MISHPELLNGTVYAIIDNESNEFYIGSTIRPLEARINGHKNLKETTKEIIKRNNYKVETLLMVKVKDKFDLHKYEQMYWELNKSDKCINKVAPFIPPEEYKERTQKYYYNYWKKMPITFCECGAKIKDVKCHLKTKKHKDFINPKK